MKLARNLPLKSPTIKHFLTGAGRFALQSICIIETGFRSPKLRLPDGRFRFLAHRIRPVFYTAIRSNSVGSCSTKSSHICANIRL